MIEERAQCGWSWAMLCGVGWAVEAFGDQRQGSTVTVLPEEAARYPAEDRNIGQLTANFHHTIPYFFTTIEVNLPVKSELLRIIRLKIESIGPRSST